MLRLAEPEPETCLIDVDLSWIEEGKKIDADRGFFVYFVVDEGFRFCKIGRTVELKKRLGQLQHACPMFLKVEHFVKVESWVAAGRLEKRMHERFSGQRVRGEWFLLEGELRKYLLS